MLKQVLFNHMISREAEEEKEETGCQLSASLPGSPDGPPAACDGSRASASSQKDDSQPSTGHTGLSETTERNGEQVFCVDLWLL